jgi:hypothetical protein
MNEPAMCFMALYRGRGADVEIVIIAPSWKRAAEIAEEHEDSLPEHALMDLTQLSTDGVLIDKDSL